jgi:lipoprotein-releasing system ATP-binding protein
MTDGYVIEAREVRRTLAGAVPVPLVRGISFAARAGEFVAITGPSGSGKSSLLYLLGLLDRPDQGSVLIEGSDTGGLDDDALAGLRLERLGFVFQFHFLLPEFTVAENVMIPMRRLARLSEREMAARAAEILGGLGLGAHLDKRPDQLSGGERQRVAIARALANDPAVLLADEPTGNLDSKNANAVFEIFGRLAHEGGRTVIAVTHDLDFAAMCDRRVHLIDGRVAEPAAV